MLVLFLYFVSGATSLVLEAVLLRELTWTLGSAASATALVLAAFLAGLALGAARLGRAADRTRRPLRLYGALEAGAGLAAILVVALLGPGRTTLLVPVVAAAEEAMGGAATFAIAFLILLVPTSLLGGTFPALARFAIAGPRGIHRPVSLLYAVNTLGGALGVFAAGFFLFESVGIAASGYLAGGVGLLVGLTALALDRSGQGPVRLPERPGPGAAAEGTGSRMRAACVASTALGGFAALGCEVVWTRILALPMRSYAYSFSLMLGLFLLGLVLGACAVFVLGPRNRRPFPLLAGTQIAMGLSVASSALFFPALLAPPEGAGSFGEFLARGALKAAAVMLPPTILSGVALPLAALGIARDGKRIGVDLGALYAWNTAGAIAGALAGALVLLPSLGVVRSLGALALASALGGLVVLFASGRSAAAMVLAAAGALACALPLGLSSEPFVRAFVGGSIGREKISEVLFFRESATDTIAIVKKDYGFHDPAAKSLVTNGIAMSATVQPVWRYMAVEGHLPVLLAASPRRALVVCVGTGITLGAVASHPALSAIDAVELSEGVIEGLPFFDAENGASYRDPRVRVIREDGRHFLERSRERYDVITVEPPPPIVAGSVHLYSLDFYEVCKKRLADGGVVAQWLPLHAQSVESARMVARTFLDAFPHAQLWLPSIRDAVLVGSRSPLALDLDRLRAAYAAGPARDNLARALLESPEALLGTYLLDREGVARWVGSAPLVTDERPRMEFFRPSGANMADRDIASLLPDEDPSWSFVRGLASDPATAAAVARESRALRLYARAGTGGTPSDGIEAARLSRGTEFFLYPLGCTGAQLRALSGMAGAGGAYKSQLVRCGSIRVEEEQ